MKKLCAFWKRKDEPHNPGCNLRDKDLKKLHKAAAVGNLEQVKEYLQLKKYDVNIQDRKYRTPLHLACTYGYSNVVCLLIEKQCKINVWDSENRSPLIKAIQFEKEDCATILLDQGGDPNLVDLDGNTALHYAVCGQSVSLVRKLLEHNANLEAQNKDGYTPLLLAITENNAEMVEFLLKRGADVNASDKNQRTGLMIALGNEPSSLVSLLLQREVDLSCQDIMDSQLRNTLLLMVLLCYTPEKLQHEFLNEYRPQQQPELQWAWTNLQRAALNLQEPQTARGGRSSWQRPWPACSSADDKTPRPRGPRETQCTGVALLTSTWSSLTGWWRTALRQRAMDSGEPGSLYLLQRDGQCPLANQVGSGQRQQNREPDQDGLGLPGRVCIARASRTTASTASFTSTATTRPTPAQWCWAGAKESWASGTPSGSLHLRPRARPTLRWLLPMLCPFMGVSTGPARTFSS
ncbi:LOW QUALITY PROTEIN: ankyrin repeat domain-containing protein 7 [Rhinolophus sinicus]|uniref:LOW QUALITY PROTEIN: ankyrin repeat domain-containing protein 7 n=1 Tax=Rhinolophus sinicus TaxID=89399 RepID=UPI003D7A396B